MVRAWVLVVVTAFAAIARAQTPDPEGARLFEEGRALAKDGKYAEACQRFEKSLELDPAIGTQLNYADCHEHLGRNADAWRLFDGAAEAEKITNPARAKFARERADALLPKVGVVVLQIPSPQVSGLAISVSGRTITPAKIVREIVDPGSVEVAASAPGAAPFSVTKTIAAAQTITIDVPAFEARPVESDPAGGTVRRRSRVYLAYGVGGAGAIALVAGVVVGMSAKSLYEEQFSNGECREAEPSPICSESGVVAQNRAIDRATIGTVLGISGLALLAGGAVLFVTAPRDLVVTPTATSQSAGLAVVGSF